MERCVQSRGWAAAQVPRPVYLFIRDPPSIGRAARGSVRSVGVEVFLRSIEVSRAQFRG